jgi:hypothetical protein
MKFFFSKFKSRLELQNQPYRIGCVTSVRTIGPVVQKYHLVERNVRRLQVVQNDREDLDTVKAPLSNQNKVVNVGLGARWRHTRSAHKSQLYIFIVGEHDNRVERHVLLVHAPVRRHHVHALFG